MNHRYRGVNVGGERHFQTTNLSLCRRNTIIRAWHALMPTCVCVVAIPRDGQEFRGQCFEPFDAEHRCHSPW